MMPKLMTKQDAIEYLLYMKHDVQAKSHRDIALDTAIEALKQPTIEPEVRHGKWIPTDDRGHPFVCVGYRINVEREELKLQWWFDKLSDLNFSDYDVKAWMPLPEPPEKE